MKVTTLDKARESLRLQQVYNVFLRYAWDILFERWESVGNLHRRMQRWAWDLPAEEESLPTGVKLRLMLEELGPTYVKVGQIVSSQASVIPAEWETELVKLQSDAQPFDSASVRQIIIEELGSPPEELYAKFEPVPFAAASTAQVHRATLHDGTLVAVKIQRPNIAHQMKADIGIMQNAARVLARSSEWAKSVDLNGMIEQFGTGALNELDYTGEAFNAYRLGKGMESIPGVRVPTVYPSLCTSKILTMEFVRGVKVSNVEKIRAAGLDTEVIARNTYRAILKQILIEGFFHADPHPGNILVNLDTGNVTFIDTGMVGELDLQSRLNIGQLMLAVQQGDVMSMAQIMRDLSVPFLPQVDDQAYYKDFERRIGRFVYGGVAPSFNDVINTAFDLMRQHGLRLDPNLTLAVKSLMQAQAVAAALDPQGKVLAEGVTMLKDLLLTTDTVTIAQAEIKKQLTLTGRELLKRIPSLSEATLKWVDQYQKGRLEVYVDTSAVGVEVDKFSRLARQIVVSILLAGMIIGSAIATSLLASTTASSTEWWWSALSRAAYLGYLASMAIAMLIVIRLVYLWLRGKL